MKTKFYAGAIFFLMLGLFASGCGAGNIFQPAPTVTPIITPTPYPLEISQKNAIMRLIPAGSFTMGSDMSDDNERPAHTVTLSSFYMDQYEVTNSLYKDCVDHGGCTAPSSVEDDFSRGNYYGTSEFGNFPVIYVSWEQAKAYCEWRGARLPSEAEWEYAARGTDERIYPWGNENVDETRATYQGADTTAVGSHESGKSPFGMYDMAGNVWEWVNDWYDAKYYQNSPQANPQGPPNGQDRVLRGGASRFGVSVRSVNRYGYNPTSTSVLIGFRCAYSP